MASLFFIGSVYSLICLANIQHVSGDEKINKIMSIYDEINKLNQINKYFLVYRLLIKILFIFKHLMEEERQTINDNVVHHM